MTVSSPIVKIISLKSATGSFFVVSGSKILLMPGDSDNFKVVFTHPEGKKWSPVAAVCEDETLMAICDNEKNLFAFEIISIGEPFKLLSVPMHLAKSATSVKFTNYPTEWALLVSDKFGDVLRIQMGEEFDRWARESRKDSKSLSIHTKFGMKRSAEDVAVAVAIEVEDDSGDKENDGSEAHHCTIIGHISMVTDLQVLSLPNSPLEGGLIVTCDRDEKVRLTRADKPEKIHSFGLAHREFVGTLAVCGKKKTVYSAGGDNFVAEWKIEGEGDEKLKLNCKIPIELENYQIIQEIKINPAGSVLLVQVDKFGLLRFEKNSPAETWNLRETFTIPNMTAFDFINENDVIISTWSSEFGVTFSNTMKNSFNLQDFDQIESEEGKEIVSSLSKSKLKKDIERMDWKQKKHANQKLPKE